MSNAINDLNRSRPLYVNLPVKDLDRSRAFFEGLGFRFNASFSNENALAMMVGDDAHFMLLAEPFFKTFTRRGLWDGAASTEAFLAIELSSREAVDKMVEAAVALGGQPAMDPRDHEVMYLRSFYDLDGHHWEVMQTSFDPEWIGLVTKMPTDRDIVFSYVFKAERGRVFSAWTEPEHLRAWYAGGAMTTCEVDLRAGGAWRFVTAGPGGTELVQFGTYLYVVPDERVVFSERWEVGGAEEQIVHATFDAVGANMTNMTVRFCFSSPEAMEGALAHNMPDHFAKSCAGLAGHLARV